MTDKKAVRSAAAKKANETRGPIERSRIARAAAYTKKHGKDDAKNPHSKQNNP